MNIAILCDYPFPNGMAATNRIINYSKGIVEQGNKVTVYIFRPTEKNNNIINKKSNGFIHGIEFKYPRNKTIRSSNKISHGFEILFGLFLTQIRILKDHKKNKIDAILISNDTPLVLIIYYFFIKFIGIKKRIFIFDEFPKPIRRKLKNKIPLLKKIIYKIILPSFNGFISISQNLADYYLNIVKKEIKTIIISSIVHTEPFLKANKLKNVNAYICYMGNLELAKDNVDNIIRAISILDNKWNYLEFHIYGQSNNNDMALLNELISSLNLKEKVFLKGKINFNEVPIILKSAKILVSTQPNTVRAQGGFPTKLGEYLVSGVPTIITNVGEISQYIQDGVNAYLVDPENPTLFSKKIEYVLENYNDALAVAENGKRLIFNKYDSIKQSENIMKFLNIL